MNWLILGLAIGGGFSIMNKAICIVWARYMQVKANRAIGWDVNFWNAYDPMNWKRLKK